MREIEALSRDTPGFRVFELPKSEIHEGLPVECLASRTLKPKPCTLNPKS